MIKVPVALTVFYLFATKDGHFTEWLGFTVLGIMAYPVWWYLSARALGAVARWRFGTEPVRFHQRMATQGLGNPALEAASRRDLVFNLAKFGLLGAKWVATLVVASFVL